MSKFLFCAAICCVAYFLLILLARVIILSAHSVVASEGEARRLSGPADAITHQKR